MARPRKNFPEKQNQNERRYTDQMFTLLKNLNLAEQRKKRLEVMPRRSEHWVATEAKKIQYEDGLTQLTAELKLNDPGKELDKAHFMNSFVGLVQRMKTIPGFAISLGLLLIMKVNEVDESEQPEKAFYKIYNLTHAQDKVLSNSPQLLQQPFRLVISLGLSEEQTVVFEEEVLLGLG